MKWKKYFNLIYLIIFVGCDPIDAPVFVESDFNRPIRVLVIDSQGNKKEKQLDSGEIIRFDHKSYKLTFSEIIVYELEGEKEVYSVSDDELNQLRGLLSNLPDNQLQILIWNVNEQGIQLYSGKDYVGSVSIKELGE